MVFNLYKLNRVFVPLLVSSIRYSAVAEMTKKTVMVVLTKGAEDMEFVISVDVLRRAGIHVTVAGLDGSDPIECKSGVLVVPDSSFTTALQKGPYDAVVLPGGPGYKTLCKSAEVGSLLKQQEKENRLIAAICAAPVVLAAHGIAHGKNITSYPSTKEEMGSEYNYREEKVVEDGNIITSRGPGTAFDFALAVAAKLVGKEGAESVAKAMLL
ncbi:Parkinson disease protein 7 homolog [Lycorma delicatula]|uniref:Parkinson disease protein 7 homolog n=1 Tax=Lycorma delicatula TaxID=130591 RepID=UPI003F515994